VIGGCILPIEVDRYRRHRELIKGALIGTGAPQHFGQLAGELLDLNNERLATLFVRTHVSARRTTSSPLLISPTMVMALASILKPMRRAPSLTNASNKSLTGLSVGRGSWTNGLRALSSYAANVCRLALSKAGNSVSDKRCDRCVMTSNIFPSLAVASPTCRLTSAGGPPAAGQHKRPLGRCQHVSSTGIVCDGYRKAQGTTEHALTAGSVRRHLFWIFLVKKTPSYGAPLTLCYTGVHGRDGKDRATKKPPLR